MRVLKEVKTVDDAIKGGFLFLIPSNYQFVEDSELVFGAGLKLLKGYYKSRLFYNVVVDYLKVSVVIDPRLADHVVNVYDDYVEASIYIEEI